MSHPPHPGQGDAPGHAVLHASVAVPPLVEETMVATVKLLAQTVPTPRHDPYYGIDRAGGPSLRLLDRLSRHGDFRKYVFVLDAGCGWGGPARWLALRYGCRVVALDEAADVGGLAARLNRRAGLADRVRVLTGSFEALPLRDGTFTQIWSVEALHHARDRARALAELFRVLRPGSPLAIQEIVRGADAPPANVEAVRHGTTPEYLTALRSAGFDGIEHEDVTDEREETSPVVLSARARFARQVLAALPAAAPWHGVAGAAADRTPGAGRRVVQFFARRPSV